MKWSRTFLYVWDLVCQPFEACKNCCDVLDPSYFRKTSPGGQRIPPQYNRWDHELTGTLPPSYPTSPRPPLSNCYIEGPYPSKESHSTAQSSLRSKSIASTPSKYTYEDEEERQLHFLLYGGSDSSTPTSIKGRYSNGYRSDIISNYAEATSPTASFESPRIDHKMPCFFSPRDPPLLFPMSESVYSSHLLRISEQQASRNSQKSCSMHLVI